MIPSRPIPSTRALSDLSLSLFVRSVIDPVSLVLEKQVPLYLDDLDSMHHQILEHASRERDPLAFEDVFALYKRVGALLKMHEAFCPKYASAAGYMRAFQPCSRFHLLPPV